MSPFFKSPEFRRLRAHVVALLTTLGAMMLLALRVQSRSGMTAEGAEPARVQLSDRGPSVQDEAYGELVKRASGGLGAGEKVEHAVLMESGAEVRGKVVAFQGVFLADPVARRIEPVALKEGEAVPDVSRALEGVLLNPVDGTVMLVTFLEPGPRVKAHERVKVEGAFWKVVTYQNRRGEAMSAPYLVAKTWTLAPKEETSGWLPVLMSITGGLAVASIVVGAQASRRRVA